MNFNNKFSNLIARSPYEVSDPDFPEAPPMNEAEPIVMPPNTDSPSKSEYKPKTPSPFNSKPVTPEKPITPKTNNEKTPKISNSQSPIEPNLSNNPLKSTSNAPKKEPEIFEKDNEFKPLSPFKREKKGIVGKVSCYYKN